MGDYVKLEDNEGVGDSETPYQVRLLKLVAYIFTEKPVHICLQDCSYTKLMLYYLLYVSIQLFESMIS